MVVANTRDKRNGRFLEVLGFYNPSMTPVQFDYDKEKYQSWISKGALVSNAVTVLLDGKYKYKKYNPKAEKAAAEKAAQEAKEAATAAKAAAAAEAEKAATETPAE